jgi:hypothetical protein
MEPRQAKRKQAEAKPWRQPKKTSCWPALPTAPPSVSVDLKLAPPPSFPLDPHLCAAVAARLGRHDCAALLQVCRYWWQALGCGGGLAQAWIADRVAELRDAPIAPPIAPMTEQRLRQLALAYRLHWDGLLLRESETPGGWDLRRFAERLFPSRAVRDQLLHWNRLDYLARAIDEEPAQASKRQKLWRNGAALIKRQRRDTAPTLLGYAALSSASLSWLHVGADVEHLFVELAETRMPPPLASRAIVAVAAVCCEVDLTSIAVWLVLQRWPVPLIADTLAQLQRLLAQPQPPPPRQCRPLRALHPQPLVERALTRVELAHVEQAQVVLAALLNLCAALLDYFDVLQWACTQPAFALLRLLIAHTGPPSAQVCAAIVRALPDNICMDGFPLTFEQVDETILDACFGTAARRWWLQRAPFGDATVYRFHRFVISRPRGNDAALALKRPGLFAPLVRTFCVEHDIAPTGWPHTALVDFLREARRSAPDEFALDNHGWTQHVGDYRALVVDLFDGTPPRALLNVQGPVSPYEHDKIVHYRLLQEAQ